MGAAPLGIVTAVRYNNALTDEEFCSIIGGIAKACSRFRIPLLGGDTGGYAECVLSASALGVCPHGRALLRSGGSIGDLLFLSGTVGRAAAAVAYFLHAKSQGYKLSSSYERQLAESWRRLEPALAQGKLLVHLQISCCAIDTSDGMKAASRQLAEASQVDAVLFPKSIPIDPLVEMVAGAIRVDPLALALGDSVDFRLFFSVPRKHAGRAYNEFRKRRWPIFQVGELRSPRENPSVWLEVDGELVDVPEVEWAHQEMASIDQLRKEK